jgi:hypothetical protein
MSPTRRVPPEPFFPPFDRDPLHVDEDLEPRIPRHETHAPRPDGAPGCAIVLAIVGIPLLICIAIAVCWLAVR